MATSAMATTATAVAAFAIHASVLSTNPQSTGERTLHAAHAGFLRYVGEPLRRGCAQQGGDLKEDADGVEQNGGPMVGCPA